MATKVNVDVDFTATKVCDPDPVVVHKSSNDGVKWKCKNAGYTFTGVTIGGTTYTPSTNSSGEFKDVSITTNDNKSTMTITDTVSDVTDHEYTLVYTDANGDSQTYDPTIRNRN